MLATTGDYSTPNVEQALAAFSLMREYFQGALIVDKEARITWIDPRYRELLKLAPDFTPYGLPVEQVIPHSLMRRVVETGRPILVDIMEFDEQHLVVCRIPLKDEAGTSTAPSASSSTIGWTSSSRSSKSSSCCANS